MLDEDNIGKNIFLILTVKSNEDIQFITFFDQFGFNFRLF